MATSPFRNIHLPEISLRDRYLWACFFLIPLWIFVVTPQLLRIPGTFSYSADMISVDNLYDEQFENFQGETYSKTTFSYEVVESQGRNLVVKNTFDVKSLDGKQIFKAEPLYGIDPLTGTHVKGVGDRDREGYLFAPRGILDKRPFVYWLASSDVPQRMEFVQEEYVYGLRVYKYKKVNTDPVDQTAFFEHLPGVPEFRGIKLESELNMWVEPVTGHLVNLVDFSVDYYFYDKQTGNRLIPYNQFSNSFSDDSIQEHVAMAKQEKMKVWGVQFGVPILLLGVLLVLLLFRFRYFGRAQKILYENRLSLFVLVVSLFLSAGSYYAVVSSIATKITTQFAKDSELVEQVVLRSMDRYTAIILGGKALFNASNEVDRNEWQAYVSTLNLSENFPGVQGLGYIPLVSKDDKESFVASARQSGVPNFSIFPEDEEEEVFAPITFLEPLTDKQIKSLGFNAFSSPERRSTLTTSRDTGSPMLTKRVVLSSDMEENDEPSFVLYVPVYKKGIPLLTLTDRRENIQGYVFVTFHANTFFENIVREDLSMELAWHVYDGMKESETSLLFDSLHGNETDVNENDVIFSRRNTLYVAGHPWTITFSNAPGFQGTTTDRVLPWATLLGGILVSVLFFGITYFVASSRRYAVAYAETLNKDLKQSQSELIKKNKDIEDKLAEFNKLNAVMMDRELKMIELKKEIGSLKNKK